MYVARSFLGQATNTLVQALVFWKVLPKSLGVHIFEEFVTFVFGAKVGILRYDRIDRR